MVTKRAVITIHGIRTRGEWQKRLAPILASNDLVPYPLDYGRFSALRLVLPWSRENRLNWFRDQYFEVCNQAKVSRPSIVAHSFGAYLTCRLIERYPREVKFDKVILAGSIAAETMDWPTILENGQVISVLNEVATKDIWPKFAKILVGSAGNSGCKKFIALHERLEQNETEVGHSGTFFEGHYPMWSRFLACSRFFAHEDVRQIRELMDLAVRRTASVINKPFEKIRSNIFLPIDGKLRIPEGFHFHMDWPPELTVGIGFGMGSAGRAYKNRLINKAIRLGNSWGESELTAEELNKIHPDLQWILSFPIANPDNGGIMGVMTIDGITDPPVTAENWEDPKTFALIRELEVAHVRAMAMQLCKLETGGF
jgi:pimeloyl-ACP methyl ester carboxylesterase